VCFLPFAKSPSFFLFNVEAFFFSFLLLYIKGMCSFPSTKILSLSPWPSFPFSLPFVEAFSFLGHYSLSFSMAIILFLSFGKGYFS
jgi:hypothetical protein